MADQATEVARRWQARQTLWAQATENVDLVGKRVLDAGTGEGHFTRFLAERSPGQLISITCDPEHAEHTRRKLAALSDVLEVQVADLTHMPDVPDQSFDVIGADFLLASVSAYTPYREINCLRELHRVLAPGGRLIVTGWEVWPEIRNQTERNLRQLFKLREAAHHLAGSDPYREHPRKWVLERLAELGMPAEHVHIVPDVHRDVTWLINGVQSCINRITQPYLRYALTRRLEELSESLFKDPAFEQGLEFGQLYAIVACKLQGGILLAG